MRTKPHFAFLDHEGPIAFAHRGGNAAGAEKENSMAAFEAAIVELGYTYIETDVIACDGIVYAIHGSKNNKQVRDTGLPLRKDLEAMTLEDITQVRIGGEPIPRLEEIFSTFPDVRVNIDAKTWNVVDPLARLIERTGAIDRVCVGSFNYKRTQAVAAAFGGQEMLCTSAATAATLNTLVGREGYLSRLEAACLQVPFRFSDLSRRLPGVVLASRRFIDTAHEAGLPVHVWTVNDRPSMEEALRFGADGIVSDEVALLKDVLAL